MSVWEGPDGPVAQPHAEVKGETTECTQRPQAGGDTLSCRGMKGYHRVKRPVLMDTNSVDIVSSKCDIFSLYYLCLLLNLLKL